MEALIGTIGGLILTGLTIIAAICWRASGIATTVKKLGVDFAAAVQNNRGDHAELHRRIDQTEEKRAGFAADFSRHLGRIEGKLDKLNGDGE
jgi:hypothetical protein